MHEHILLSLALDILYLLTIITQQSLSLLMEFIRQPTFEEYVRHGG